MAADDGPTIGLALGSGGARGLAHAGVLQALEEEGLRPDVIAGTSMGAIVGGLYAETADAEETWRRLARFAGDPEFQETWAPFIPRGGQDENGNLLHNIMDGVMRKFMAIRTATRPALVDAERLLAPLRTMFRARSFADLKLPFSAVGIDLISGEKVVFREGDLLEAIYASSAIPGIFPPVDRDGRLIVDGGAPFHVPINTCRELGADMVVAVDIPIYQPPAPVYRTGLDMIMRSGALARMRLDRFVLDQADLVVRPDVADHHWADFRSAEACRLIGYRAGREAVPALRELLAAARRPRWRRWLAAALRATRPAPP